MSGASAFRTGLEAMRLGGVIYVAPFLFVLNPALIGQAPLAETLAALAGALIGVWLMSCALQGHLSFIGGYAPGLVGAALRVVLFIGGLLIAAPGAGLLELDPVVLNLLGLAIVSVPIVIAWRAGREPVATK